MSFDICEHKMKLLIIKFGKFLHPEEKNVTRLYLDTCTLLGIAPIETTSLMADHIPTLFESARKVDGHPCPQCQKNSLFVTGLCKACKDSENGKYKTVIECKECGSKEKSEEPVIVWLQRWGVEFGNQTKESLGIKTLTDEGLK